MLYLKLFPCFCFDCEKQKIVFELIINQIVKRIELLVIVRLYCESENNIYLMRNKCLRVSICVCRFACVDLRVWKIWKKRSDILILFSANGQDEPVDTRISKSYCTRRSFRDGSCHRGSQASRWMRVQLHREGVMLVARVDTMRAYLMSVDNTNQ